MFAEKLSSMLNRLLKPQPKYITVAARPDGAAPERMLPPDRMPAHVAIIMDGNGRWAQNLSLIHI